MNKEPKSLFKKGIAGIAAIFALPLVLVVLVFVIPVVLFALLHRYTISILFRIRLGSKGIKYLVVTSNSPVWHDYVASRIIPPLHTKSVVLNYSEKKQWNQLSLPAQAFHAFAGSKYHTPIVIYFKPWWNPRTFRFYQPFKYYKHGKPQEVEAMLAEVLKTL